MRLKVNGKTRKFSAPPHRTLLEVLREDLRLTGTKHGCESGECGACTVLLDGRPVYSCLTLASQAQGMEIQTIEGVSPKHPLVSAFADGAAVQCGYCTPGVLLSAKAYLEQGNPKKRAASEGLKEAISGNLCRCTGYYKILEAVKAGAAKMKAPKRRARAA